MWLLFSGSGVSAAVGNTNLIVGRDAGTCSVSSERIAFGQLRALAQVLGGSGSALESEVLCELSNCKSTQQSSTCNM